MKMQQLFQQDFYVLCHHYSLIKTENCCIYIIDHTLLEQIVYLHDVFCLDNGDNF